jgi:hypothetical protein
MWQIKRFKTREKMRAWLDKNSHRIQWEEVFLDNGYAVEWRRLRIIG